MTSLRSQHSALSKRCPQFSNMPLRSAICANKIAFTLISMLYGLCCFPQVVHADTDCVPLSAEQAPVWDWNDQDSYRIIPLDSSGRRFRVVGDVLNITADKFKSIVGSPNARNTKVEQLIFDARQLNIDASLPFESARIVFLAEQIRIGPNAVIALIGAPRQGDAYDGDLLLPSGDGVAFAARQIKFDSPKRQFLYFTTGKKARRHVTVIAEELVWAGPQGTDGKSNEDQAAVAIKSASLDEFLSVPTNERSYTELIGPPATSKLATIANQMMLWPQAFATKLIVSHARGAYNSNWTAALKGEIARERGTIESWGSAPTIAAVNRTEDFLDRQLDPYGRSASYAPSQDLKSLRDGLEAARNDLRSSDGYVQSLERTIVDALKDTIIDQKQLSAVRDNIVSQSRKIDEAREKQIAANNAVHLATQKYDSALKYVKQLEEGIKEYVQQQIAEQKAGAENLARANYIAVAVSLIPGGSWLGASAQLWGRINSGQFNDGKFSTTVLQKTFEQIYDDQKKYNDAAEKVRTEWKKADNIYVARQRAASGDKAGAWKALHGDGALQPGWEPPTSRALLVEFAKSIYGVVDAAKNLSQTIPPPHVLEIKETEAEAKDERLQAALVKAEEANAELTRAHDDAKQATEAYINATSSLEALEESESNLLGRSPVNDLEKSTKAMLAESLLRQRYRDIDRDSIDLKRAAIYANGQPVNLDYKLSYFFDSALSEQLSFVGGADLIAGALAEVRRQTDEALVVLLAAADRERKEYSKRLRDDGFSEFGPVTFRAEAINSAGAFLIGQLNESIAQQIKVGSKPLLFAIPVAWQQGHDQHPKRFVDAVITGVKLKAGRSLLGKTLSFRVVHPGFGTINLGTSCRIVDTRVLGQDGTDSRVTSFVEGRPFETYDRVSAQFHVQAGQDDFRHGALPLRTQYQIEVRVVGDPTANDWKEAPQIGELSISFATIQ